MERLEGCQSTIETIVSKIRMFKRISKQSKGLAENDAYIDTTFCRSMPGKLGYMWLTDRNIQPTTCACTAEKRYKLSSPPVRVDGPAWLEQLKRVVIFQA